MEGPDHKASLEPHELRAMIRAIRNIERSMGDGIKRPTASEIVNKINVRKSIVAGRAIKKAQLFSEGNLTTKRPGNGINPMDWKRVIGKKATRNFIENELIVYLVMIAGSRKKICVLTGSRANMDFFVH